ncbi:hypothetical protein [Pseudarthrobacter sp. MEB009]|uniref:hypothetical protein n=1 Tax=Pseudarthrobacter sp. MEB009 TaxID=3040326 RepID=UPI0025563D97|nr:hypothetical protein [Pseudarthrobacter sp. MEB009]
MWVVPLASEGMFADPPEPETTSDGLIRDHHWAEIDYLTRVAPDVPTAVVDILLKLKGSRNPWVRAATFRIGASIPAAEAARLKQLVIAWNETGYGWRSSPPEMVAFAANLLNGGQRKAGIAVANLLFRPRGKKSTKAPELVIDEYWYEECLPTIIAALGDDALKTALHWLEEYERDTGHLSEDFDMTYTSRSSIRNEDDRFASVEHALIDAVRDATTAAMAAQPQSTRMMLSRSPMVLARRITLHATTEAIKKAGASRDDIQRGLLDTATELLADGDHRDDACRIELCELARELAGHRPGALEPLVAFIKNGPPMGVEEAQDRLASYHEGESPEAIAARVQEWIETWQHRWLSGIGNDALPAELKTILVQLDNQRGSIDSPLTPLNKITTWSGPNSPLSQDEMSVMGPEDLAAHLESWQAGDTWGPAPSHEGQGRELSALITTNPRLLDGIDGLVDRLRPTYLRSILQGWEAALKAGLNLDWELVTELIHDVLTHSNTSRFPHEGDNFDDDNDFRGAKKAAVNLLEELAKKRELPAIPEEALRKFAALLLTEAEDETAWAEYDSHKGDMDPLTLSLNLRWPIRVHGLLNLISHGKDAPWFQTALAALEGALAMPDVHGASRAVLGEGLGHFLTVAPNWIGERANELFGTADGLTRNQQIAMTTAMAIHRYHREFYAFLEPCMLGAVQSRIPLVSGWKGRTDPVQQIGEWAIYAIIFDHRTAFNPLAGAFFTTADPELRGQALGRIAWSMTNVESVDEVIRDRLAALWDSRVEHVRSNPDDAMELNQFHWFIRSNQFHAWWWLPRLKEALELSPGLAGERFMISKQIASSAELDPQGAFEATRLLLSGKAAAGLHTWDLSRNAVPMVIARARQSGDPDLERQAIQLMNELGESGYSELESEVMKAMSGEISEDDLEDV